MPKTIEITTPHPFEYQRPTPEQVALMQQVNELMRQTYDLITAVIPNGRERALAITNLQQSRMWVNAAIVLNP